MELVLTFKSSVGQFDKGQNLSFDCSADNISLPFNLSLWCGAEQGEGQEVESVSANYKISGQDGEPGIKCLCRQVNRLSPAVCEGSTTKTLAVIIGGSVAGIVFCLLCLVLAYGIFTKRKSEGRRAGLNEIADTGSFNSNINLGTRGRIPDFVTVSETASGQYERPISFSAEQGFPLRRHKGVFGWTFFRTGSSGHHTWPHSSRTEIRIVFSCNTRRTNSGSSYVPLVLPLGELQRRHSLADDVIPVAAALVDTRRHDLDVAELRKRLSLQAEDRDRPVAADGMGGNLVLSGAEGTRKSHLAKRVTFTYPRGKERTEEEEDAVDLRPPAPWMGLAFIGQEGDGNFQDVAGLTSSGKGLHHKLTRSPKNNWQYFVGVGRLGDYDDSDDDSMENEDEKEEEEEEEEEDADDTDEEEKQGEEGTGARRKERVVSRTESSNANTGTGSGTENKESLYLTPVEAQGLVNETHPRTTPGKVAPDSAASKGAKKTKTKRVAAAKLASRLLNKNRPPKITKDLERKRAFPAGPPPQLRQANHREPAHRRGSGSAVQPAVSRRSTQRGPLNQQPPGRGGRDGAALDSLELPDGGHEAEPPRAGRPPRDSGEIRFYSPFRRNVYHGGMPGFVVRHELYTGVIGGRESALLY